MVVVAVIALLGLGIAGALVLLSRALRGDLARMGTDTRAQLEQRTADVDRRLQGVIETMDRRLGELDTKVDRRLATATQTTTQIHEQLGKVNQATAEMIARAKDLGRLEQALRPPKARGGFGELLLENLLRDRLPPSAYELQFTFKTGERVDAIIRVEKLVPIDAKFPLDNFERMVDADGDDERQLHEKAFGRDVKGHIDAIASKYVRPDEGTYDFVLMRSKCPSTLGVGRHPTSPPARLTGPVCRALMPMVANAFHSSSSPSEARNDSPGRVISEIG